MSDGEMALGLALNIVDLDTRLSALRIFDGPIASHKAFVRACRIVAANGKQVRKALQERGFKDFSSFLAAYDQLKSERERAGKNGLDDAISHLEETIPRLRADGCEECARENEQLKTWLEELRDIRMLVWRGYIRRRKDDGI